jgi:hypothetical protein
MNHKAWAVMAVFLSLILATERARASVILDQSNATSNSAFSAEIGFSASHANDPFIGGQVFTVGVAGILDHLTVFVFGSVPNSTTAATSVFEIRPTTASGAPVEDNSQALTRFTVTLPNIPFSGFGEPKPSFDIDVSSFQIPVTVGEKLYFDLGAATENLALAGFDPPNYAGGNYYFRDPDINVNTFEAQGIVSLGFQTYVNTAAPVPEPSSVTLFAIAGVALLTCRRWRQPACVFGEEFRPR